MKSLANIIFISVFLSLQLSCTNSFKDLQKLKQKQLFPSGVAENFTLVYTDSAKVKAILKSKLMKDFSSAKYPFQLFPKGVRLEIFDQKNNKHIILADRSTVYKSTGIIELEGNVKITSSEGKVFQTQQLFYNQKKNWFFTESYFKTTDSDKSFFEGIGIDFDNEFKTVNAQQNRGIIKNVNSSEFL